MLKRVPLYIQILIGLGLGVTYGAFVSVFTKGDNDLWTSFNDFTYNWISPWGTIFISCLKLIAVPLVLFSLVSGIASLKDISRLGKMGGKAIMLYLSTTVIAVTIGLLSVNFFAPWEGIDRKAGEDIINNFSSQVSKKIETAESVTESGPLSFLVDMVPSNFIEAASDNSSMLQVIVFAILFGVALISIDSEKAKPVKNFFEGVNDVVLKMVDFIMYLAPIGTFALIADVFVSNSAHFMVLLEVIGKYFGTVVFSLLFLGVGVYPLMLWFFTKKNPITFFKNIAPAQLLAFSTSSSAATLPVTMDCVKDNVGVDEEVVSFVLPLGATINMDGTSCYQAVAAVFIANMMGFNLTFMDQLSIVLTATLASIGSAAVPGAGMVMLAIVLGHLGVDMKGIALILGVDRLLDMCRTVVNVTGDATIATIIGKQLGQLKPEK
jgi:Na+/H+-dicarboxylate symporter